MSSPRNAASRQYQLHAVRRRRSRALCPVLRRCDGDGIDGITVSPGYAYERPDQQHFLTPQDQGAVPRHLPRQGTNGRSASPPVLDFLAGNQEYHCTPWGNRRATTSLQRPCYLLGEGYAKTFRELMEETDWDAYGTGNYEKCANCMVHSGYEATRSWIRCATLKALAVAVNGVTTDGEMAPEITLEKQRPASTSSPAMSSRRSPLEASEARQKAG